MKQLLPLFIVALTDARLLHAQEVSVDISPIFQRQGVEVTAYTSPGFTASLTRLIGAGPAAATAWIHPYTLLVENTSSAPLFKVVIRYGRKDSEGRIIQGTVINTIEASPPNAELVFTPDTSLTPNLNATPDPDGHNRVVINQTFISVPGAPVGPNFDRSWFQHAIIAPDLVIFADGGIVGPNTAGVLEFVKTDLQSELDLLNLLNDRSKSDEQVFGVLKQLAAWKPTGNLGWREDLINGYQKARAKALLQRITKGETRDGLAQFLEKVVVNRKPSVSMLHRLN